MNVRIVISLALLVCIWQSSSPCNAATLNDDNSFLRRWIRAAGTKAQRTDCRYEKGTWEECDPNTGVQRRALKLKALRTAGEDCEPVKHITRSCKNACRYAKGQWSPCVDGEKKRTDTLKQVPGTSKCEASKIVTKKCKPTCRYSKSEWSPCENGIKSKTLTLTDGAEEGCEESKKITKQCGQQPRATNKQNGKKSKKANVASS